jgi:hypothetical protein
MSAPKPQLPTIPRYAPGKKFMAIPPEWWAAVRTRLAWQRINAGAGLRIRRTVGRTLLMRR